MRTNILSARPTPHFKTALNKRPRGHLNRTPVLASVARFPTQKDTFHLNERRLFKRGSHQLDIAYRLAGVLERLS